MKKLSFTHKMMVFLMTVIAVAWVIPLQAVEATQYGVFADLKGGELSCFSITRDEKELGWSPPGFNGWFNFGDKIAIVKDEDKCGSASITILAGNKVLLVDKNMKLPNVSPSSSDPMVVVLNEELKTLLLSRPSSGKAITRGKDGCNLTGTTQYLFTGGTKIYLPLDKKNCPSSKATGAQLLQLTSCQSNQTTGNPNDLQKSLKADKNWLVLEGKKMTAGQCYQLNITDGSIGPIKIEAVTSVTSASSMNPASSMNMELQIYQWQQQGQ